MRVLIAGATGALGVPIVRSLVSEGHDVTGVARTTARAVAVERLGARVVAADALDADLLRTVVMSARPEAVVHALTAIPPRGPVRAGDLAATNRLRIAGTRNLLGAAIAAGVRRIVVESMVFIYGFDDLGDVPLTEDAPPARHVRKRWLQSAVDALVSEETQVLEATRSGRIEGIVLRFGGFYGLGAGSETMIRMLRRRVLPVVNQAASRALPWIEITDAAAAMVAALSHGRPGGVYNLADDEGVPAPDFIRYLARAIGAPRPLTIPAWVVRLVAPFAAAAWLDTTLTVSNARARRELGWSPAFPNYRDGIAHLVTQLREHRTRLPQRVEGAASGGQLMRTSKPSAAGSGSPFACNRLALTPAERRRHFDELGPTLRSMRIAVRELPTGFAFQFPADPKTVQLIAEWAAGEHACCPFLDIDIRVEREGGALWLSLTGPEGTKEFVESDLRPLIGP